MKSNHPVSTAIRRATSSILREAEQGGADDFLNWVQSNYGSGISGIHSHEADGETTFYVTDKAGEIVGYVSDLGAYYSRELKPVIGKEEFGVDQAEDRTPEDLDDFVSGLSVESADPVAEPTMGMMPESARGGRRALTESEIGAAIAGSSDAGAAVRPAGGRKRVLTQYSVGDNSVAASRNTQPRLEAGVYIIQTDMNGRPFFERVESNSDSLLRFEDSRYNEILDEVNKFWKLRENFARMGLTHKRGVLLHGSPGQGKSCLLALVREDAIKSDTVVFIGNRYMSATVAGLKEFKEVEPDRQALVMLEDMDEICRYDEHGVLEMMDGGDQMNGVLVIGTTNYLDRLPPRVLRSGRFDTKMEVKAPPIEGRLAYFKHKLAQFEDEAKIREIAEKTDGFSFAQMREFIASVYCYERPMEASIDRIRRNFNESTGGSRAAKSESVLNQLMSKRGLLDEGRLRKMDYQSGWRRSVLKHYPSAVFSRQGAFEMVAKAGTKRVGRYDDTTGLGEVSV